MALPAVLHAIHPKISLGTHERAKVLPVALGDVLPDGGLPRGAVVELTSPQALGRATTIALRACAAAQAEGRLRSGATSTPREAGERVKHPWVGGVWCAFVDPWSTLHAPAVVARGVDATRLLVVRPPLGALARVVVRLAESRVFSVIVVDTAGVPGAASAGAIDLGRWSTVVRRVALAVERTDTSVILLTDATVRRAMPLPVALRLEIEPKGPGLVSVRVAKERHGRLTGTQLVELERAG